MKTITLILTVAALAALPVAALAQGTYLSNPSNTNNHVISVAPSGNVGIGTTSPEANLHVEGRSPNFLLRRDDGTSVAYLTGHWADYGGNGAMLLYRTNGEIPILLTTSGASWLNGGNVGIGTTRPATKLDVSMSSGNTILSSETGTLHLGNANGTANNFEGILFNESNGNPIAGILGMNVAHDAASIGVAGNLIFTTKQYGTAFPGYPAERMRIDSTGNVGIGTTTPQAKLDVNGKINCTVLELTSDRNAKAGFTPVDTRELLQKVVRLPISTWYYTNAPGVRHLGPMAQDFHTAFRLGTGDKHIATVDADGVLFASVQALHQELQETKAELAAKDTRIAALEQELAQMESLTARLAAVEQMFARFNTASTDSTRPKKSSNLSVSSALQGSEGAMP